MSLDRDTILRTLGQAYASGMRLADIASAIDLPRKEQPKLRRMVGDLVDEGVVERVGRGKYGLAEGSDDAGAVASPQAVGRIRVHPAGYGFVEREDEMGDVFVPAKYRGDALDGDRVRLYTWEGFKGTEGRVEEVLARGRAKLTGVVERAGRTVYLEPDDPRISTDFGRISLDEGAGGARLGDSVVVDITRYPTEDRRELAGRVVRVLGRPDDPATEIEKILVCADIPVEFPGAALAIAERTSQEVGGDDFADRIDLRDRDFVTIDPETARDFDDALCIERGPHGGPRVWVAVADVSHYVRDGDALDLEARIRGVSVYLPDRVVPMLPMQLSAGICSLNPEVDRCAMVVRIDYDDQARVVDTGFAAAVIRSKARLDYPGVAAALTGDFRGRRERYRPWADDLRALDRLARALRDRRRARGTLELEIAEAKVLLDEDDPRLVRDVVRSKGSEEVKSAYELVEEFMIAANEAVGAFFEHRGLDTVWRVHAPPAESRVEELAELLSAFGVHVDVEEAVTPLGMRDVLEQVADLPSSRALSFLCLRSLKQAVYDTTNVGHFGLASSEYVHFTSPIRRYPDLLVHRLLKHQLHREGQASGGGGTLGRPEKAALQELAAASSAHERRAVEAEREAVSMYRAYLMRDHVGEEFAGRVTGVTSFGVFVEIDEPFVEGLIKIDSIGDDYFDFDALHMTLSGRKTGMTVALGDEVRVEIVNTSVALRRIELRLVAAAGRRARGARTGRGGGGKKGRESDGRRGGKAPPKRAAGRARTGTSKGRSKSQRDGGGRKSAGKSSSRGGGRSPRKKR